MAVSQDFVRKAFYSSGAVNNVVPGSQFYRLRLAREPARKSYPRPIILQANSWAGAARAPIRGHQEGPWRRIYPISEGEHNFRWSVRPACAFVAFQHDLPTPRRTVLLTADGFQDVLVRRPLDAA